MSLYLVNIYQSSAKPNPICYKLPPSNTPTPPILDKYRKRYNFLQKKSPLSRGLSSIIPSSVVKSLYCPWTSVVDKNDNRLPPEITYATCDNCDQNCKAAKFNHQVVYKECDYKTGEETWRWTNEELAVAYVYAKP